MYAKKNNGLKLIYIKIWLRNSMSEYMPDFCLKKMSEIVRIYYMSVGEGSSKKST